MADYLPPQNQKNVSFIGVGWIGRNRLEAVAESGLVHISSVADSLTENCEAVKPFCEDAAVYSSLDEILKEKPDGVVIATPSALHTTQSLQALNNNVAVFCQKPLGRNAIETAAVVHTARKENLLLGVDLSYRHTCFKLLYDLVQDGSLGKIYAIETCFHNAYGPDKDWFYKPELSGGGCLIDLGVHLIDLAAWCLGNQDIKVLNAALYNGGEKLIFPGTQVEDHAIALMEAADGTTIQLNCSWNLPAGKEAEIYFNIYGTKGGASFRNIRGSFYDFEVLKFTGTQTEELFSGKDNWGGRAIKEWCQQLANGSGYNSEIESVIQVAEVIDQIYLIASPTISSVYQDNPMADG